MSRKGGNDERAVDAVSVSACILPHFAFDFKIACIAEIMAAAAYRSVELAIMLSTLLTVLRPT
jgi:hypothetical protein